MTEEVPGGVCDECDARGVVGPRPFRWPGNTILVVSFVVVTALAALVLPVILALSGEPLHAVQAGGILLTLTWLAACQLALDASGPDSLMRRRARALMPLAAVPAVIAALAPVFS